MKMIKILSVLAAVVFGLGITVVPASADADTIITVTIKNHPDNGHGTPSHWADDTFTRTVIVHPVTGSFNVTVKDSGTFTTRKNAGSPNDNVPIVRKLTGTFTSIVTYANVVGTLDGNKVGDLDGNVYDDKAGTPAPSTTSWGTALFATGATGGGIVTYSFVYKTLDEQWIDASDNNDGMDNSAGDVTGKLSSKLTVANSCRVSKADKRNVWTVANAQGDRARSFKFWVKYNGHYSATQQEAVGAGQSLQVITPGGGRITIMYYDGYGVQRRAYAYSKASILCD